MGVTPLPLVPAKSPSTRIPVHERRLLRLKRLLRLRRCVIFLLISVRLHLLFSPFTLLAALSRCLIGLHLAILVRTFGFSLTSRPLFPHALASNLLGLGRQLRLGIDRKSVV